MKVLFVGGTGTISTAISKLLVKKNCELYVLNRGTRNKELPECVNILQADINDEEKVKSLISNLTFDVVADFICYTPEQLERDYRLFNGKTKQFMFISSASIYQKPISNYKITEGTPLYNPYWEYSRNKIACEEFLNKKYREDGFPITIIRPSHTYSERSIPTGFHGSNGSWQIAKRMLDGKPVIIHGDGTSLWTLTHSEDFAKGFIGLMGNIHAIGESIHITSDEVVNWNQIYSIIADALGVKLNAIHVPSEILAKCKHYDCRGSLIGDKANSVVFDNSKLKKLVPDFVATIRVDQGIKRTVNYILENKEYQKEDIEFDKLCDKIVTAMDNLIKEIDL